MFLIGICICQLLDICLFIVLLCYMLYSITNKFV